MAVHLKYLIVQFNIENVASPQRQRLKNSQRILLQKQFFKSKREMTSGKYILLLLQCLKSFTQTPTITPTSYPNKIYKNCFTAGKKTVSQHLKYSTHYFKIFKRCITASFLVITKVTQSLMKIIGAGGEEPTSKLWKVLLSYKGFTRKWFSCFSTMEADTGD